MPPIDPIYIGHDAAAHLRAYVQAHGLKAFALIADENTYAALGEHIHRTLAQAGCTVATVILPGNHIHTDEHQIMTTFVRAPLGDEVFLAVGSGTITDITRFVSHRSRRSFIAVPTAPSVDGFTSVGAPTILGGVKMTILCQPPRAVFADIDVMAAAPPRLIAAGFGDMIGKINALIDWQLGGILWDERYDAAIAARTQAAVDRVLAHADAIGAGSAEGVQALMQSLIESGLCMLDYGASHPASGAEHHIAHYWEMQQIRTGGESMLHGAQVGVALVAAAEQYARVRALSRSDVLSRLEGAELPDRAAEIARIREGYGAMADIVLPEQSPFLDLDADGYDALKRRIAERWSEVEALVERMPTPETLRGYLRRVGAPTDAAGLGLSADEAARGVAFGHYLRNRFTVFKLSQVLGLT